MEIMDKVNGKKWTKVHISKNLAKMAYFRLKIGLGRDATFAPTFNEHNSAIFYPILTFDRTKMTSSARQVSSILAF